MSKLYEMIVNGAEYENSYQDLGNNNTTVRYWWSNDNECFMRLHAGMRSAVNSVGQQKIMLEVLEAAYIAPRLNKYKISKAYVTAYTGVFEAKTEEEALQKFDATPEHELSESYIGLYQNDLDPVQVDCLNMREEL